MTTAKATTFQTRQPDFHDLWGHLRAPERVDIRSKYPKKHSVTLVKDEDFLRRRISSCFFASCFEKLSTFSSGKFRISFVPCISEIRFAYKMSHGFLIEAKNQRVLKIKIKIRVNS